MPVIAMPVIDTIPAMTVPMISPTKSAILFLNRLEV